jgi:pimeloyl-ACP methyl ester carboxylesterase
MNVVVNGFSMAYDEDGQGSPLVLVHGYPLNRQMWQPQVEALSAHARVLAVDLRGHGDSEAVPGPYSMDLFADDLNAFLDALDIREKVVLGGLSMGGYAVFAFYRRFAARVRGLILTATRAAPDSEQARSGRDQSMVTAREKGVEAIVEGMAPKMLAPQTVVDRPLMLELAQAIMRRTPVETILGDLEGLKQRPDSTPTLEQISVPTLIVHGADDQIVPLQEAQAMQKAIAGARLVVVPDAGHLLNLEQPEMFNQAVTEFLRTGL